MYSTTVPLKVYREINEDFCTYYSVSRARKESKYKPIKYIPPNVDAKIGNYSDNGHTSTLYKAMNAASGSYKNTKQ